MMTSETLCAACCAGEACHRPRSPDFPCSTSKAPQVLDHQREHAKICSPLFEGEWCIGNVSIMHPGAAMYRTAAAQTDGGAAARSDVDKTSQYQGSPGVRGYGPGCYHSVPLRVGTYGRLGKPFITHVWARANQQGDDKIARDQFITGVLRELTHAASTSPLPRSGTDRQTAPSHRLHGDIAAIIMVWIKWFTIFWIK
jgi:hypothetical protein